MGKIKILDQQTIDRIAAGEVVERPASIVKELVENSIDAHATQIRVEIKDGGLTMIRITDNGDGIAPSDIRKAFLRHATSKIRDYHDLQTIGSLGFRGEALSSIAAVATVDVISRTAGEEMGIHYGISAGEEKFCEPMGAPFGTTITVRNLFLNVPARRKFMKTPMTEGSHVQETLMHLALSHPEISVSFTMQDRMKFQTNGSGKDADVIYEIYGRELHKEVFAVESELDDMKLSGMIGTPVAARANRSSEHLDLNGRYFNSSLISKAIEDACAPYFMARRFPFTDLHLNIPAESVDVNVHPAKMEVKFSNAQAVYAFVHDAVAAAWKKEEHLPDALPEQKPEVKTPADQGCREKQSSYHASKTERPIEISSGNNTDSERTDSQKDYFLARMRERVAAYHEKEPVRTDDTEANTAKHSDQTIKQAVEKTECPKEQITEKPEQLTLFDEDSRVLTAEHRSSFRLLGQVFRTYWLVEWKDRLLIIDQHAAHEKVLYERICAKLATEQLASQMISPPLILKLMPAQQEALSRHAQTFARLGFEIEQFGGDDYAVRGVPSELESIARKELLEEILEEFCGCADTDTSGKRLPESVAERLATISCKAAVKGNQIISAQEMNALLDQLLSLENPYHCPHGRPTMIEMTETELEKRFKRIV